MAEPTSSAAGTAEAVAAGAPAAAPKPAPAAPKPAAKAPAKPAGPTRRIFIVSTFFGSWFAVAWTTFTASMLAMLLGTVRFLFPNVLSEPPSVYKAGAVSDYEEGKVDDKYKEFGFWVIRAK